MPFALGRMRLQHRLSAREQVANILRECREDEDKRKAAADSSPPAERKRQPGVRRVGVIGSSPNDRDLEAGVPQSPTRVYGTLGFAKQQQQQDVGRRMPWTTTVQQELDAKRTKWSTVDTVFAIAAALLTILCLALLGFAAHFWPWMVDHVREMLGCV